MPDARHPSFGGFDPTLGAGMPSLPSLDRPFTVPLLIRGSAGGVFLLLFPALIFLLLGVGARMKWAGDPLVPACLFFAFALAVATLVKLAWSVPRRRWLEVSSGGFVISSRKGKIAYRDDQVVGISFRYKFAGIARIAVTIETDSEKGSIRCSYVVPPNTIDPLAFFWGRLQQAMTRRVSTNLGDGASLTGMGWRYDASGLGYTRRFKVGLLPVEKIQKAGVFDGNFCLWKDDEELPFLRLPTASRNIGPLASLIWEKIGDSSKTVPLPGKPLGRVILVRRSADLLVGLGGFLLVVSFFVVPFLPRPGSPEIRPGSFPIVACCAALFASPFLIFCWRGLRYRRLVFHEFGVSQPTWGGKRELLFSEVETFTCNGNIRLDFLPAPGSSLRPIYFRHCIFKYDLDLTSLIAHLGKIIMARMGQNLTTDPIPWTAQLRFLPGGLEYKTRRMFGSDPAIVVPYHLTSYQMLGKHFFLYITGQPKPVVKELIAGPNFYPGWYLLQWVYTCLQQQPTPSQTLAAPVPSAPPVDERFTQGERGVTKAADDGG